MCMLQALLWLVVSHNYNFPTTNKGICPFLPVLHASRNITDSKFTERPFSSVKCHVCLCPMNDSSYKFSKLCKSLKYFIFIYHVYLCIFSCVYVCVSVFVSHLKCLEGKALLIDLFLYYVSFRDQLQIITLSMKHLSSLNHLVAPVSRFIKPNAKK